MAPSAANTSTAIVVNGRRLPLSNLDKVLYPATGFTKGRVIEYYARIAGVMLPHLRGHPLSLLRFPNGVGERPFFQKNCPEHRPRWVRTTPLRAGVDTRLCMADSEAALVWLANLAALEIHPYLWTTAHPQRPSLMVYDLDPGPSKTITDCCRVALRVRDLLDRLDLVSFPKTSGKKGLHLLVPLNTSATFDDTKEFAKALAQLVEREEPRTVTTTMTRSLRVGRVFIDWSQNDRSKTTVAPYSLRGADRPMVSAPLSWREVESAAQGGEPGELSFDTEAVLRRVARRGDLAADLLTTRQRLPDLAG